MVNTCDSTFPEIMNGDNKPFEVVLPHGSTLTNCNLQKLSTVELNNTYTHFIKHNNKWIYVINTTFNFVNLHENPRDLLIKKRPTEYNPNSNDSSDTSFNPKNKI